MKNVILELTRIQKEVLEMDTPQEQVRKIVDSISEVVGTDVCSLYLVDDNGDMELVASHGLKGSGPIKIPAGKGLVGMTAQSRHPINVPVAADHPNFYYVKETEEERFQSFCGVPLVRYGKVIGVLVVQSVDAIALSAENEAFLVTLSSQLALLVDDLPVTHSMAATSNIRIPGVRGSSGIGIGKAVLYDHGDLFEVSDAPCEDIDGSIREWHQLLDDVKQDIIQERDNLGDQLSGSVTSIFNSYQSLLEDPLLITRVETEIRAGHWLPGALRKGIQHFSELFRAMEDPYLRARHEDIHHIGNKLYNAWRGRHEPQQDQPAPTEGVIVVGAQISVSDIAALPTDCIRGIACFKGSSMSHSAILANALGIPAVLGLGTLKHLKNGERLIVDGNIGQLIRYPSEILSEEYQRLIDEEEQLQTQLQGLRNLPATTRDEVEVRLYTNSGLLADLSPGLRSGAQGIGLYRTEIPFMVRDGFPSEREQMEVYQQVFEAYRGKPVYMRTLDIGGDKQLSYFPITNEENPALGWRGIRFTLDNIQLLMTQVRAMIRSAGDCEQLHILLPMVSGSDELDAFNELLGEACRQLSEEGHPHCRPKVGIMVEVPAAVSQIPFWACKIDFVSIGSNDLSQYLLALDRDNSRVAGRYDHIHPAVLHEVNRVVKKCRRHALPLSLCGEMASDPVAVVLLLGMGIRTLSMSANRLPRIKWLIRSVSIAQCEGILRKALAMDKVDDIRALVKDEVNLLTPEVTLRQEGRIRDPSRGISG